MYRGTTPTYTLTLPEGIDLTGADQVIVTISDLDMNPLLEISNEDLTIDENEIELRLTQDETLALPAGQVLIQVNWTFVSGSNTDRACSEIVSVPSLRNLHNEVI